MIFRCINCNKQPQTPFFTYCFKLKHKRKVLHGILRPLAKDFVYNILSQKKGGSRQSLPYAFEAVLSASWNWGKTHKSTASNNHCILVEKERSTMSQSHIFQVQSWQYSSLLWTPHAPLSLQHQALHGPVFLKLLLKFRQLDFLPYSPGHPQINKNKLLRAYSYLFNHQWLVHFVRLNAAQLCLYPIMHYDNTKP